MSKRPSKDHHRDSQSPRISATGRRISGGLQPAHEFLLPLKHFLGFIAEFRNELITGFREPWNAMRHATVFFLVSAFSAPIVNLRALLLPVTHHVPLNQFIR